VLVVDPGPITPAAVPVFLMALTELNETSLE
jgi:hypothetical protein